MQELIEAIKFMPWTFAGYCLAFICSAFIIVAVIVAMKDVPKRNVETIEEVANYIEDLLGILIFHTPVPRDRS